MNKRAHPYTQGGQIWAHRIRMWAQVFKLSLLCALFFLGVFLGYKMFSRLSPYELYLFGVTKWALFKVSLWGGVLGQRDLSLSFYNLETQRWESWDLSSFLGHPYLQYILRLGRSTFLSFLSPPFLREALSVLLGGFGVNAVFFWVQGKKTQKTDFKRGAKLVAPKTLARVLQRKGLASDLKLAGVPLLKNKETQHILVTGTTGSGKSNCLHTLLPQIRARPNRAILVDLTGELVRRFYREGQDLLLNPLDPRTQLWSLWAECSTETHFEALAQAIVPVLPTTDPFWREAAKDLLAAALRKMRKAQDSQELYRILVTAPLGEFCEYFRDTPAAAYTHPDGEKMTLSIRATLVTHIQCFRYLKEGAFSLRAWVQREEVPDQWLFLTTFPDARAALVPLIRGQMDTALSALMAMEPDPHRRLWFVLDELPALQKLPSLSPALAEGRKYGGCVLAGMQSFAQLTEAYGPHASQSLLDLFNTKIFFRSDHPQTNQWISQVLGERETLSVQENVSYGASTIRDGISLSEHQKREPLVLPTEIAHLPDLQAYLKLPGPWPITKMKMEYQAHSKTLC